MINPSEKPPQVAVARNGSVRTHGENCNLEEMITAKVVHTEGYETMVGSMDSVRIQRSAPLKQAVAILAKLYDQFGVDTSES